MARETHDREDLLRDARALEPRVQFDVSLGGGPTRVFAGFRGASLSIYFDDDPVFHFNSNGELRRAFVDGRLIKSEDRRLVSMEREALPHVTELRASDFSPENQSRFFENLAQRLEQLRTAVASGAATVIGKAPADSDALPRLAVWLEKYPRPSAAASPRVT